jgi:hypothetical protein
MPSFAVDSNRHQMIATGICNPEFEWMETPEGRRRPSETQARDEHTGMPLWQLEVTYRSETFGREYTATAMVTVGGVEKPHPATYTPITFEGLQVDVHTTKAGGLAERWKAEAVRDLVPAKTGTKPSAAEAKSEGRAVA